MVTVRTEDEGTEALSILTYKRNEVLSGGAFERYEVIPERARTRYPFAREDTCHSWHHQPAKLGLGYIQALLALLGGCVQTFSFDSSGYTGRATIQRTSIHQLSWNDTDKQFCRHGGFPNATPNYLVAILGFLECVAFFLSGEHIQCQEVIAQWYALLHLMEEHFPRDGSMSWSATHIQQACRIVEIRVSMLHFCDALRAAMQYNIPASQQRDAPIQREVRVFSEEVITKKEGLNTLIDGTMLLSSLPMEKIQDTQSTQAPELANAFNVLNEPVLHPEANKNIQELSTPQEAKKNTLNPEALNVQQELATIRKIDEYSQAQQEIQEHQQRTTTLPEHDQISPLLSIIQPFLPQSSVFSVRLPLEPPESIQQESQQPTNTAEFHLSPAALITALACEHRYRLKYIEKLSTPPSAAAWFGTIAHSIVERAYYGRSLKQSHEEVWRSVCPSIADVLQAWLPLEFEYRDVLAAQREKKQHGLTNTWHKSHPDYRMFKKLIQEYQEKTLSFLRWYPSMSLTEYYRRSALLARVDPQQVLFENMLLVEGVWLPPKASAVPPPITITPTETEPTLFRETKQETLLECRIGGVRFVGRPDYVAIADNGEIILADMKTGKKKSASQLAHAPQLCIYREMLWQNDIIARNQAIRSGHRYLTDKGIEDLWDDGALHEHVLSRIEMQATLLAKRRAAHEFQPVYGTPHEICSRCYYTQHCEWTQTK